MYFGFTDDQLAVRDAVGALLDKQCDVAALQAAWAAGGADGPLRLWSDLAAMGVQGMLAPVDAGGSGFDTVAMALVLAETGRVALPLPVMETAAVGVPVVAASGDPSGVLGGLIDGSLVLSVAGESGVAPAAGVADLFLVDGPGGAMLYPRESVEITPVTSVDRTRDLGRVRVVGDGVALPGLGGAGPGSMSASDLAALGAAAQLVGLGRALVSMTVDYVKERKQFGVPIGSFQAVKHHLANAHLQVEFAAPAVWAAAWTVDTGAPDCLRAISMAKAMTSDAGAFAARVALQCHGAMGYADEYPLHMWMKRVWCLAAAHGSAGWHRDRVGRELGI